MRAGELRHRVTIQKNQPIRNSYGEMEDAWINFATVWASIEGISGREYFMAHQTQAQTDYRIKMRYIDGVKPSMRVIYGVRIFNIQSVLDPDGRRKELHLMCKEVV